ncbi:MAG: asparagine synthase (glutamine-hydrolyzing), partial [Omnitrophica bacterium GWA2_52_8]
NGEIYNYQELRRELQKKGCLFRSRSDTEVILHLYEEKGTAMLNDLRGMFAFSLWDVRKNAMLLARDPLGIKPLYYADDGWTLRAASQVKALLQSPHVSRSPEPAGIVGFFLFGSVPGPFTIYQEIRELPAGSYIWVDALGPRQPQTYFSTAAVLHEAEAAGGRKDRDELRSLLEESLRYHLIADVPVSLFLSSGLDSAVLAVLARKIGGAALTAMTLGFEALKNTPEDETPGAAEVARLFGPRHEMQYLSQHEFSENMQQFFHRMDQPSIDGLNVFLISRAAAAAGFKVALSGIGSDEFFGGYPSFERVPAAVRAMRPFNLLPGAGELAGAGTRFLRSLLPGIHPKLAGLVKFGASDHGAYFLQRALFLPDEMPLFLPKDLVCEGMRRLDPLRFLRQKLTPRPKNPALRVAVLESSVYMRQQLLRDADWAGMAHSLEIRTPYADAHLLKKMAGLLAGAAQSPGRFKNKVILKESMQGLLPESLLQREKTGFRVPVDQWLLEDPETDDWKKVPELKKEDCPWARRWAYVVFNRMAEKMSLCAS